MSDGISRDQCDAVGTSLLAVLVEMNTVTEVRGLFLPIEVRRCLVAGVNSLADLSPAVVTLPVPVAASAATASKGPPVTGPF